ncbi:MAG: hypothetical protein WC081_05885 [Candidatus Ratteibacteria bacterium]|jgi:Tfp pilus assembly protein PilO
MKRIPLRWFLIAGVTYLALMVSLFMVLIFPQNRKIKELKVKLNSDTLKSSVTQQEEEIAASRNSLKETGAILKNRLFIPEKSILTRLLGLAKKASVRVSSVAPTPRTDIAKTTGEISFKIVFTGNYRQIVNFIHLLESDQALFRIDRLTLENTENLHRGEIEVVTYTK